MDHKMRRASGFKVIAILVSLLLVLGSSAQAQVSEGEGEAGQADRQGQPAVRTSTDVEALDASAYLQAPGTTLRVENTAEVESSVPIVRYGCIYVSGGSANGYLSAAIFPPEGATLTLFRAFVYDASPAQSRVTFAVLAESGSTVSGWSGFSTGSAGDTTIDLDLGNTVVDYSQYSYLVWWQSTQLGNTMMFCGFRLNYIPEGGFVHLPAVMKEP